MKKVFLTVLLTLSAQIVFCEPFRLERSGEYAVYHDSRGDYDFFRAYWGHNIDEGGMAFFIRNIDGRTGEQINYMVQLGLDDGGELEIRQIKGLGKDDPPGFRQSIPDLMNFIETAYRWCPSDGEKTVMHLAPNYTLLFDFNYNLPLFSFGRFGLEGDGPSYFLTSGGAFGIDELDAFFALELGDIKRSDGRRGLDIEEKQGFDAGLLQYRISLDANWSPNTEQGFPGYWLSVYSYRDSQIMLESINWEDIEAAGIDNIETFIRKTLYSSGDRIFMDEMKIEDYDGKHVLSYFLTDSNSNYNYVEKAIWIENDVLYIFNFSTFADIYIQNKAYYRKIIESFRSE